MLETLGRRPGDPGMGAPSQLRVGARDSGWGPMALPLELPRCPQVARPPSRAQASRHPREDGEGGRRAGLHGQRYS